MVQWLGAQAAFPEVMSSIPNNHNGGSQPSMGATDALFRQVGVYPAEHSYIKGFFFILFCFLKKQTNHLLATCVYKE